MKDSLILLLIGTVSAEIICNVSKTKRHRMRSYYTMFRNTPDNSAELTSLEFKQISCVPFIQPLSDFLHYSILSRVFCSKISLTAISIANSFYKQNYYKLLQSIFLSKSYSSFKWKFLYSPTFSCIFEKMFKIHLNNVLRKLFIKTMMLTYTVT